MKKKVILTSFLIGCFILVAYTYKYMEGVREREKVEVTILSDEYHYEIKDGEIAEILDYNYEQKSMYISGLKVFEEFITSEFGSSNEGSVSINEDESILTFNMTISTGTITGTLDGPSVHFEMDIASKEIINKNFEPAPDYIGLGKTEFAEHSEEIIELSDERMIEIGTFFYGLIEDMKAELVYPPSIMWNEKLYYVQGIKKGEVEINQIDEKIGVTSKILSGSQIPLKNGEANIFSVGSKIYKIKDIDINKAVAIEYNDKYIKCVPKTE